MGKIITVTAGKNFFDKNEYLTRVKCSFQEMSVLTTDAHFKEWHIWCYKRQRQEENWVYLI